MTITDKMKDAAIRRIEFLLNEARHSAKRDQVITYAMRVISNIASIGKDAGSSEIKLVNRIVSKGAQSLLHSGISVEIWTKSTINEHPVPLKETWDWIIANVNTLSTSDVWNHFVENRMATLLISEDRELTKLGLRSSSGIGGRYIVSGVSIIILEYSPKSYLKNPQSRFII